ncbi:MAG: ATPase [Rubrivivax sp.]|jgi:uncharacterized protein YndB with AHSA1/START domain|nr:ATPase [Rubrivivax sp.]MBK7264257.1 ATPase [Rubrivivax sp.]MBK8527768.1 ATPase [Rubrivivax sp.]
MNTKAAVLATVAVIALAGAGQCRAELTATSATSFTSTFRSEVAVSQATAWRAITQLPRWWNDQHTWSGQAANMVLELHAGGCWCERWGEGRSVMHGQVVWVQPGQALRLNAALGPLQELGAGGVFTLVTSTLGDKTFVRLTYRVAGAPEAGLDKLAPEVDQVLAEQWQRLLRFTTTGSPTAR